MEERIVEHNTTCHQRHRPLRRTRAVIGLLLLTTTNYNSSYNSYSSGLAEAFTTPLQQQQRISPSHPPISISSSSLFAKHRSSSNNAHNNERVNNVHNNSKKRKSTELEVSQHYLQGIGEATYNNTIISNAELPRGFSFADDDEGLADSLGYGSSGEGQQSYEVSAGENNLQGTISSSSPESTIATNGNEEYTINMSKYYINDDNYDGDHYDYDMNAEIDGSLIGTYFCLLFGSYTLLGGN